MERVDLVFSYWIFFWFILYQLNIVSYSPHLLFYVGLLENAIILSMMIYYSYSYIGVFILVVFLFKAIPLWLMRNESFRRKDVYASVAVLMMYLLWTAVNRQNVFTLFASHVKSIQDDKPWGPFTQFVVKLLKN